MTRAAVGALVLALTVVAGCGGNDGSSSAGDRTFTVADVHVDAEGGLLLVGTATRGAWDSEADDHCDGDGSATRDLAVLEMTADGRLEGVHALDEDDLDGCAVEVKRTSVDEGQLLVEAVVREPLGLLPGDGGPESRERPYATRFDPADDEFDDADEQDFGGYAEVAVPGGDVVTIEEDSARQRRTDEGFYTGTISLIRWRKGGPRVWSRPARAIAPDVDTHEVGWDAGRGWELFFDSRRGIYGFAHYSTWSGEEEAVLFRHKPDGGPDTSFAKGGRVLVEAPWFHGTKRAIRLEDGDFVVAGAAGKEEPGRIVLRRFSSEGERRPMFDRAAARAVACGPPVAIALPAGEGLFIVCSREGGLVVVHAIGDDGQLVTSFGRSGVSVVDRV